MARKIRRNQGITVIKKSNQLIEARYKFDIWETRVFLSVLAQIRREDEDFKVYRIWYRDVIRAFGLRSAQSYGLLRDAGRSLMRKVFNVSNVETGFLRETEYHIIRSVNYLAEGEAGAAKKTAGQPVSQEYVDITVDPEMKPLLLQLQKNFTAYDLRNVVKLGAYPVRVYELLKQYESIGERTMDIEQMKRMLELTTEYPMVANFFQKVIQPAVRDINAHTDITVTDLEKVKAGKRVVAVRFTIRSKSGEELRVARGEVAQPPKIQLELPLAAPKSPAEPSAKDVLFVAHQAVVVGDFGVTPSSFLELLEGKTAAEVEQAVRVTRRARAGGQIKTSVAGFFVEALKKGFTDAAEEKLRRKTLEEARAGEKKRLESELLALQDEQAERLHERIRELTSEDPTTTTEAIERLRESVFSKNLLEEKETSLGRALEIDDFRQDRTLREWVKATIFELRRERFEDILDEMAPKIEKAKTVLAAFSADKSV